MVSLVIAAWMMLAAPPPIVAPPLPPDPSHGIDGCAICSHYDPDAPPPRTSDRSYIMMPAPSHAIIGR